MFVFKSSWGFSTEHSTFTNAQNPWQTKRFVKLLRCFSYSARVESTILLVKNVRIFFQIEYKELPKKKKNSWPLWIKNTLHWGEKISLLSTSYMSTSMLSTLPFLSFIRGKHYLVAIKCASLTTLWQISRVTWSHSVNTDSLISHQCKETIKSAISLCQEYMKDGQERKRTARSRYQALFKKIINN